MAYTTPAFLFLGGLAYLHPDLAQAILLAWLAILVGRLIRS